MKTYIFTCCWSGTGLGAHFSVRVVGTPEVASFRLARHPVGNARNWLPHGALSQPGGSYPRSATVDMERVDKNVSELSTFKTAIFLGVAYAFEVRDAWVRAERAGHNDPLPWISVGIFRRDNLFGGNALLDPAC